MNTKINSMIEDAKERFEKQLDHLFERESDRLEALKMIMRLPEQEQETLLQNLEAKYGE